MAFGFDDAASVLGIGFSVLGAEQRRSAAEIEYDYLGRAIAEGEAGLEQIGERYDLKRELETSKFSNLLQEVSNKFSSEYTSLRRSTEGGDFKVSKANENRAIAEKFLFDSVSSTSAKVNTGFDETLVNLQAEEDDAYNSLKSRIEEMKMRRDIAKQQSSSIFSFL